MKKVNYWDRVSKTYDATVEKRFRATYDETVRLSKNYLRSADHVLDFACGTGIITLALAPSVKKIIAIDISGKMIDIAREKTEKNRIANIEFRVTDLFDDGLKENSFNAVLAFNILHLFKDSGEILERINRLLIPGGILLSATDCLGEKIFLVKPLFRLLYRLKILPYMRIWTPGELGGLIASTGFTLRETKKINNYSSNYFMAARKSS